MHKMGSDDCVAEQEAQRRRPYRKGSTDTKIKPGSNFKRQSPVTSQTSYHDIFIPYYRDIRIAINGVASYLIQFISHTLNYHISYILKPTYISHTKYKLRVQYLIHLLLFRRSMFISHTIYASSISRLV